MLLTIGTRKEKARDLGYVLAKHPDRCQEFELPFGRAYVFYPQAEEQQCTAAMLLDVDPVGLVRGRRYGAGQEGTLAQYVNDRPYVASSFLSVAIGRVFSSAMKGVSKGRQELAEMAIPLDVRISAIPSRGGEQFLRGLFEPLGYEVEVERIVLDEEFPDWGEGNCFGLRLQGTVRVSEMLTHLYVLVPVLDNNKHYWVGDDEIDKLMEKGGQWLKDHPMREQITTRYLKHQRSLVREALERIMAGEEPDPSGTEEKKEKEEQALEQTISLNDERLGAVLAVVREVEAKRVIDLGCGEGRLIKTLLTERSIETIVGVDVSMRSLERASQRLKLLWMPQKQRDRIELVQSSLTYRDDRFSECDVACVIEVIEHIEPSRLASFERVLFEFAKPPVVIVTTPNIEYNVRFETLPTGRLRHRDHRFEWTRAEFQSWGDGVAARHGYQVRYLPIGPEDLELGPPTQMAVFEQ